MVSEQNTNGRSQQFDLMEVFNTVTTFILFNMLWLFGSLLIITIPAMTAALFASVAPWARGQSPYTPLLSFGRAVRQYWLKATVIGVLDAVLGGLIMLNLLIIRNMGFEQFLALPAYILTISFSVVLILANVYVWPLLVTLDQPLKALFKNAMRLTVVHPFWGVLIAVVAVIPIAVSTVLPRFFFLTVSFAGPALITYWGAWRIIRRYLDEDDLQKLGVE